MLYIKIHNSGQKYGHVSVIAICDPDLIGKEFAEGNTQLVVSERFYKGDLKSEEEITEIVMSATNINFTGKESVSLGLKLGLITKENIKTIQGVPHAQSTKFAT
jgi:uncharacterized protein